MHMGEFLKDICDISGGGHKNAAGGDLFSTTLDELFK
jgi:oligoribonuclease NrnB/cAMP/cGMP phosphodiesterase (DHH superfamily)